MEIEKIKIGNWKYNFYRLCYSNKEGYKHCPNANFQFPIGDPGIFTVMGYIQAEKISKEGKYRDVQLPYGYYRWQSVRKENNKSRYFCIEMNGKIREVHQPEINLLRAGQLTIDPRMIERIDVKI